MPLCQQDLKYTDCSKKGCPGYDTKLHLMVKHQLWRSGEFRVLLHCSYSQVPYNYKLIVLSIVTWSYHFNQSLMLASFLSTNLNFDGSGIVGYFYFISVLYFMFFLFYYFNFINLLISMGSLVVINMIEVFWLRTFFWLIPC